MKIKGKLACKSCDLGGLWVIATCLGDLKDEFRSEYRKF